MRVPSSVASSTARKASGSKKVDYARAQSRTSVMGSVRSGSARLRNCTEAWQVGIGTRRMRISATILQKYTYIHTYIHLHAFAHVYTHMCTCLCMISSIIQFCLRAHPFMEVDAPLLTFSRIHQACSGGVGRANFMQICELPHLLRYPPLESLIPQLRASESKIPKTPRLVKCLDHPPKPLSLSPHNLGKPPERT